MEDADFSGYATKAGLECSDGRVITPEAFRHQDKMTVPLVWQHGHNSPENVLGHAILEARPDGVYAWGFLNGTKQGQNAKALVQHGDIKNMSIYANRLVEKMLGKVKSVLHGQICEVSLVLAGANKGAVIDWVRIQHSDDPADVTVSDEDAIIHTGLEIEVPDSADESETDDETGGEAEHSADDPTIREIYDSWSQQDKDVAAFMVQKALEAAGVKPADLEQGDKQTEGDLIHDQKEEPGEMGTRNVFDQNNKGGVDTAGGQGYALTHSDCETIFANAKRSGDFMGAVKEFALSHGIDSVESLFPDAKMLTERPEWIRRRSEWVDRVINGTRHLPFAKIKNMLADLTYEEARAKGYITGEFKKEQWFPVSQRTTGPSTVYKKQKMDRDTLLDITDFDVVAWLWEEMRFMIKEELARAILIGDGRAVDDPDKIKDPEGANEGTGIRSILHEHHVYATTLTINLGDANSSYNEVIEELIRARSQYRGTGTPDFFCTYATMAEMLLIKDTTGRRLYDSKAALANALMVNEIVEVEVMEDADYADVLGIFVNLVDYAIGTNRGGELTTFDDFNIDYNTYTYLIETRLSGALTKYKSAVIVMRSGDSDTLVTPTAPAFVSSTGVVTIPSVTGVVYKNDATDATLASGAQTAIPAGTYVTIRAEAASGYYLRTGPKTWTFKRDAA